jgi:uroporphyrinogen III methyltransferase/synthase
MDRALDRIREFDWLVFTSAHGVRFFLDRIEARGHDLRIMGHLRLAAIGPTTAEALARYHLRADIVPASYRSEALAEALAPQVAGRSVLLARANRGRAVLRDELQRVARVEQVAVYCNADAEHWPAEVAERLATGSVDWVTLTSPAIAERFAELLPPEARGRIGREIRLASLSPVTSEVIRRLGWPVAAEAEPYTWEGLVAAILRAEAGYAPAQASSR